MITNPRYLDTIHEYVDVHGTFNSSKKTWPSYIPKYVKNHGVIDRVTLENLLQKSKVFVGLGFPFEGPAPLEAIANGAAFLNPKFPDPLNRYNSDFFAMKPTRRLVTSQNPYAEQFIGEPYVYTIDIKNVSEVSRAMEKIMKTELKPYLPYEYTHEGMLERMSAQVEHLEFCKENQWPPLKNMMTVKGKVGQTCKDACWNKGLLCEPSYWEIVNHKTWFKRVGLNCEDVKNVESLVAPSYDEKTKICYLQNNHCYTVVFHLQTCRQDFVRVVTLLKVKLLYVKIVGEIIQTFFVQLTRSG
ncbi:alpha-1,6-mannosylglycoprotein 6-beta-N-acetylglucosaminyltransferase A-like isoform X2 [Xenia sp. Carnegie-2017]|uniref:alpha-1,6-mannosylglycoprotein 6-beta-N-acetylglucosaminyltransferase A-like isoform X2 n=1 Tax=Xenia sp. Carnegie-2017 TaxID=2897299 RepID=UPI001F039AA1|nr:alpha-1,6-mannosylglycoprotein 6-beta-N-acetylglucosaminyltransferase A-like isoform X2 [Xenia sp. Carnegie-2017]